MTQSNEIPVTERGDADAVPLRLTRRLFVAPLIAVAVALALIPFSAPVARVVLWALKSLPVEEFINASKQIAQASTIVTVAAIVWVLVPRRRAAVVVFAVAITLSSGSVHMLKHTFRRARPDYSVFMGDKGRKRVERLIRKHPETDARPEARDQWLLVSGRGPFFDSKYASFPSGHTTAAFSLAAFLCFVVSRLRWLWLLWAAGCGLARVYYKQHFIEDVLVGAAYGWSVTCLVFAWPAVARWGHRVADRLTRRAWAPPPGLEIPRVTPEPQREVRPKPRERMPEPATLSD